MSEITTEAVWTRSGRMLLLAHADPCEDDANYGCQHERLIAQAEQEARKDRPQPDALPPFDLSSLPERVVVGKNGAYWREYGDQFSMCIVSTDNDPIEVVAVYVRLAQAIAWRDHAVQEALAKDGDSPIPADTKDAEIARLRIQRSLLIQALAESPIPASRADSLAKACHKVFCKNLVRHEPGSNVPYNWPCRVYMIALTEALSSE